MKDSLLRWGACDERYKAMLSNMRLKSFILIKNVVLSENMSSEKKILRTMF